MPELPEVEAARRAVEEHCKGLKIKKSIIANDFKVIDGVSSEDFEASILGKTIVAAHRKGKHMWIQLDSPPFPTFQFGEIGRLLFSFYKRNEIYRKYLDMKLDSFMECWYPSENKLIVFYCYTEEY